MRDLKSRQVLVTGATGFIGQHVVTTLRDRGATVVTWNQLNLHDEHQTRKVLEYSVQQGATLVIHLAYPGGDGIADAQARPGSLAADLLRMDLNVIEACARAKVEKLVCIGSVCAYPEVTALPTTEADLHLGYPEAVNASYGMAKRMQLTLLQAYRQELGLNAIHLVLGNIYGPGDTSLHVIPALIRRMLERPNVCEVWGQPSVSRSFLYVEDAAEGIVRALERYDDAAPLNLVSPVETHMRALVQLLCDQVPYSGAISYDETKPTGHLRRMFDTTRMSDALDWLPSTTLSAGLQKTIDWLQRYTAAAQRKG